MLYEEFKARTDKGATIEMYEDYNAMYMASSMDKDEFCKMVRARVRAEIRAQREAQVRFVRITLDACPNGNVVYSLYCEVERGVIQWTGYHGVGLREYHNVAYRTKRGLCKMTKAEKAAIRTMDCCKVMAE